MLQTTPTFPSHHALLDLLSDKVEVLTSGNNSVDLLVGPDKLDLVLDLLTCSQLPYNTITENLQEDIDHEAKENDDVGLELRPGSSCSSRMSWTR